MAEELIRTVERACGNVGGDPTRLLDVVHAVNDRHGFVGAVAVDCIAAQLGVPRVEVEGVASFYASFASAPPGRIVIRLCDDVVDRLAGGDEVRAAVEARLGIRAGETTADGRFTLEMVPCIGLSDQAPAALVNGVPVPSLSPGRALELIDELERHGDPRALSLPRGDGLNGAEPIRSAVRNNLRQAGEVLFAPFTPGAAIHKAAALDPAELIRAIKTARLRGRGGAGFPTGMKWEFTRAAAGERKVVICNADEGEPGTFKDRVLLTEAAELVLEGMTIAARAIGADLGILYLRDEYRYLRAHLEQRIEGRRRHGLLGPAIAGIEGFDFDVRIQLGAGAYVCGEETALIESCEGRRGDPRNRPPFPAQAGYLGRPTSVNNVETLAAAARIVERGARWFDGIGTSGSSGTKALSVSGDCERPGVYELPFGVTLHSLLEQVGAPQAGAVLVGGASGRLVPPSEFHRRICFDDLATGGSLVVFDRSRDPVWIAREQLRFFAHESCGHCTPCRVGTRLLGDRLEAILDGRGTERDLEYLRRTAEAMRTASRCGLGLSAPNPVLGTLEGFADAYRRRLTERGDRRNPQFDLDAALAGAVRIAEQQPGAAAPRTTEGLER